MKIERGANRLRIAAIGLVSLLVLDRLVLTPLARHWRAQSERIARLREDVQRGELLIDRQEGIRARWREMLAGDLPEAPSVAEDAVLKAVARWVREGRVTFTSLAPQWQEHDAGYRTFECRATATGDQESLARFLHALETDPLPVRIENCELSSADARGRQLTLNVRFSALSLGNSATQLP